MDYSEQIFEQNIDFEQTVRTLKFERMCQSPYSFLRGSNQLFAMLIAPKIQDSPFCMPGGETWVQGDLHAYNYGIFDDDRGEIIYDLNDFDDSLIADYQFDVARMAVSIMLIVHKNGLANQMPANELVPYFLAAYMDSLSEIERDATLKKRSFDKNLAYGKLDNEIKKVESKNNNKKHIKKWTHKSEAMRVFDLSHAKMQAPTDIEQQNIKSAWDDYLKTRTTDRVFEAGYFDVIDIARRISSGTGSLGRQRYYVLLRGKSSQKYGQVILDIKEQGKPSLYAHLSAKKQDQYNSSFLDEGRRHARAYMALSRHTDDHLGWLQLNEKSFSVRERSAYKAYFPTKKLTKPKRMRKLVEQWAAIIAAAHARSHHRFSPSAVLEKYQSDKTEQEQFLNSLVIDYLDINQKTYDSFCRQIK